MNRARSLPFVAAVAAVLAAFVLGVGVAAAKFPYFSVELDPPSPRPGEPVTVIVRLWDDEAHTQPASWWPSSEPVSDLLEFRGDDGRVPVTLTHADDAKYRGEVVLSEGDWQLFPFPRSGDAPGIHPAALPSPLAVTVAQPAADLAPFGWVAASLAAIAVAAMVSTRRPVNTLATGRRSPEPHAPQT